MKRFVPRTSILLKRMASNVPEIPENKSNDFRNYIDHKRGFRYYVFDNYLLYKTGSLIPNLDSPETLILKSFEEGRGVDSFKEEDENADVERARLHDGLRSILVPDKSKQYAVIVGENGCGKSTAVRKVLSYIETPRGAVYFNCPESPESFSTDLMKVLYFSPILGIRSGWRRWWKDEVPVNISKEPLASFLLIRDHLLASAELFKEKHGRPMVLVIDSTDVLAKEDPKFLGKLQDFAKNCADQGTLRIVFISSDGSALSLFMSRSAWSRAEKPPFEIGEIDDQEAVAFLVKRSVPTEEAEKAVKDITGGLFAALNDFISNHKKGKSHEEIVKILDKTTNEAMKDLTIEPKGEFFKVLVDKKFIYSDQARDYFSKDQLELMLKHKILAVHPNQTYTTFYDRHVAVWFAKNLK